MEASAAAESPIRGKDSRRIRFSFKVSRTSVHRLGRLLQAGEIEEADFQPQQAEDFEGSEQVDSGISLDLEPDQDDDLEQQQQGEYTGDSEEEQCEEQQDEDLADSDQDQVLTDLQEEEDEGFDEEQDDDQENIAPEVDLEQQVGQKSLAPLPVDIRLGKVLKQAVPHEEDAEIRNLASPDNVTRENAMSFLGSWLSSCKHIEEAQLMNIWKSLFCRVWHTTKGPAHVELSKQIALFLGNLTPDLALLAFKALLSTMVDVWSDIEKHRIEKFRSLLQVCLRQMLRMLETEGWDERLTRKFSEALGTQGMSVCLARGFLQELRSFLPPTPEILKILLEPYFTVFLICTNKMVLNKVKDAVFSPLLQEARTASRNKSDGNEEVEKSLGSLVLGLSMAGELFELSESAEVSPSNRKFLTQLHEQFRFSERSLPLRPLRKIKPKLSCTAEEVLNAELPSSSHNKPPLSPPRRVLRSEKKVLQQQEQQQQQQQESDGSLEEDDSVVLNLENKLMLAAAGSQAQARTKRVRFCLQSNIVWTPNRPLPPEWVRVPPCATPRGSALKPGVLRGPICMEVNKEKTTKRKRKESQKKKVRKSKRRKY